MLEMMLTIRLFRPLSIAAILVSAMCSLSCAQELPWHNAGNPEDVNADQTVWADDVMPVLNCLHVLSDYCIRDPETGAVVYNSQLSPPPFLDVAGMGNQAVPLNALRVINKINQTIPRIPPASPITTGREGFKVRLAATDASGNTLETVGIGETFWLKAYVSDARPNALGVYAAYLDIAYPAELLEATGAAEFGPSFTNGHAGDVDTAGLLDSYGGMIGAIFPPNDSDEHLLFAMPLRGVAGGDVTFAMQEDSSYGLLFGIDPFVATDPTTAQIRVVPEPSAGMLLLIGCLVSLRHGRTSNRRRA